MDLLNEARKIVLGCLASERLASRYSPLYIDDVIYGRIPWDGEA